MTTPGDNLTPHAQTLITALRERGDWVGRVELAHMLGKPHLTIADTVSIESMVSRGIVEIRTSQGRHLETFVEYKAK